MNVRFFFKTLPKKTVSVLRFVRERYRAFLLLLYLPLYMICFELLEHRTDVTYHLLSTELDHDIPLIPVFVIPYYMWFGYMAFAIVFEVFQNNSMQFYLFASDLFFGMTLFLVISYIYPNALDLRPSALPDHSIFCRMITNLWAVDTPTNVMPSIHVYNSIGAHMGLIRTPWFRKHPAAKYTSAVFIVLVILATIFIKQHSLFDVTSAIALQMLVCTILWGQHNGFFIRLFRKYDPKHAFEF